jgi:hypothetical protein
VQTPTKCRRPFCMLHGGTVAVTSKADRFSVPTVAMPTFVNGQIMASRRGHVRSNSATALSSIDPSVLISLAINT